MNLFATADEHYFHKNIIKYDGRPFTSMEEMHDALISNHNSIVTKRDLTIHVGDFSFADKDETEKIIKRLNGQHIFVRGSHDYWMKKDPSYREIFEKKFNKEHLVFCHYAMKIWPRSHYGSWLIHGHSHGDLNIDYQEVEIAINWIMRRIDNMNQEHAKRFDLIKDWCSLGKSLDVGVKCWNYYPVSFEQIKEEMDKKPVIAKNHGRKK
jgi:calcineurin-like phosphoesterase family protein